MKRSPLLAFFLTLSLPLAGVADELPSLPDITVRASRPQIAPLSRLSTADTAQALQATPGLSSRAAGGVAGLPVLRGLAADRIKVQIDGAEPSAACGNQMNPPLSYIDPHQVASATVMAGLSPVSMGGDNIAGVIRVASAPPRFADVAHTWLATGEASLQTRSVERGRTAALAATVASDRLSLGYSGATTEAASYRDGHGRKALDTLYQRTNQTLTLAAQGSGQRWVLRVGEQRIPYQGFANQYMDMTDNRAVSANLGYEGAHDWGQLSATLFWQDTRHEMGFFSPERTGSMPMTTRGRDSGYTLQADVRAADGVLRLGHAYRRFRLDDHWPAVPGSMMMGPQPYVNIQDGQRDRIALFGEWEGPLAPTWLLSAGVRGEHVISDAGAVQGYGCGMMCAADAAAAAAFNARDRRRRDANVDATLTASYEASPTTTFEIGVARKTRSPNLYERYTWGRSNMAMTMIGWFGDGNGYVGDVALRPEVAHTLSATWDWHDVAQQRWGVRLTPFYTHVQDYIDADRVGTFQPYQNAGATRALLRFANHDARLYGINLSWQAEAWRDAAWGTGTLRGKLDWTRGQRRGGGDLYHVMPANLTVGLDHEMGVWRNHVELVLVARKAHVDQQREEPATPGYGLLNLGARYTWRHGLSLEVGVRNVFDHAYDLPLGGVQLAALKAGAGALGPLPGPGRSIDVGVSLTF